jgi:hypothetical protein
MKLRILDDGNMRTRLQFRLEGGSWQDVPVVMQKDVERQEADEELAQTLAGQLRGATPASVLEVIQAVRAADASHGV